MEVLRESLPRFLNSNKLIKLNPNFTKTYFSELRKTDCIVKTNFGYIHDSNASWNFSLCKFDEAKNNLSPV